MGSPNRRQYQTYLKTIEEWSMIWPSVLLSMGLL